MSYKYVLNQCKLFSSVASFLQWFDFNLQKYEFFMVQYTQSREKVESKERVVWVCILSILGVHYFKSSLLLLLNRSCNSSIEVNNSSNEGLLPYIIDSFIAS